MTRRQALDDRAEGAGSVVVVERDMYGAELLWHLLLALGGAVGRRV